MKFLRGSGDGSARDDAFYYYVRCNKCGEHIRVRVDRVNDLAQDFEGESDHPTGYVANKGVVGKKCFRVINLSIRYDSRRKEASRSIDGGTFIAAEEYEEATP
jgi:hypothetical protein